MNKECTNYRKKIFELIRNKLKCRGFQNMVKTISEDEIYDLEGKLQIYEKGDPIDLI